MEPAWGKQLVHTEGKSRGAAVKALNSGQPPPPYLEELGSPFRSLMSPSQISCYSLHCEEEKSKVQTAQRMHRWELGSKRQVCAATKPELFHQHHGSARRSPAVRCRLHQRGGPARNPEPDALWGTSLGKVGILYSGGSLLLPALHFPRKQT